ncbi:hypothetical protein TWF569_008923 [Orbilia oligospora]|uniref:FAD-binding PCMH-type domain-containing protein n=1 Tax=Orbilia oligospora TaxID=2813651 RepID=A0A7C8MZC8_ORBOL|nr:hypothetical protein TWF102_010597 [Orbilia oligospora]KAF3105795.1 hypothetical protein TWF103_006496 [Orbilia oligospora]KAF3143107.1 hypothetical protein TWF594_005175 [Orbilia oligospora]KAF3155554.1 hypothetical protein TWF569_008923 [Orbilia oligospora]
MRFLLSAALAFSFAATASAIRTPGIQQILGPKLSSGASIALSSSSAPRWSQYEAPRAQIVVNVGSEKDVAETVKYCNENRLGFLAQTSGHGWANTWTLDKGDVIINLRALNTVNVDKTKKTVTVGGGAIIKEIVEEVYKNQLHVVSGGCNCVGTGFMLGGGLGRLMGEYGLAIDNLLSLNLVTADGNTITASASSGDLWWALRGAGHNFGIVTSYVVRAHPWINNGTHWSGNIVFSGDQVEAVTKAIDKLAFQKAIAVHYYFAVDPSSQQPVIIVNPFYAGKTDDARKAFKPILDLKFIADTTGPIAWNDLNTSGDFFCEKGSRKPAYSAGLKKLDPKTFRNIWDAYVQFIKKNGVDKVGKSAVLVECYSYITARAIDRASTAYPHRDVNFQALILGWYDDKALDREAEKLGKYVREQWLSTSGFQRDHAYINFARGDEPLAAIYGESWRVRKLAMLKKKWDPKGRFSQYFPIPAGY